MKNLIIAFVFLLTGFASLTTTAQTTTNTYASTFGMLPEATVTLDFDAPVDIQYWDKNFIRIETTVTTEKLNPEVLQHIQETGRYIPDKQTTGTDITLYSKKLKREVTVNSQPLKEVISYTVYLPDYTLVQIANDAFVAMQQ